MKQLSPAAAILIVVCLVLLDPCPAKAGWPAQSGLGLTLSQNEETDLSFRRKYVPDTGTKGDYQKELSPSAGLPGYWFADFPWLGLASASSVIATLEQGEESLETSIEADTNFDPLSSLILLRYRNWRLEPFVGIGPVLIFSEIGKERPNSLNHMFLGIFYRF